MRGEQCHAIKVTEMCSDVSQGDEYIDVVDACKEVLWMKNFLKELIMKEENYNIL